MNFLYISPNFPTYGWKFCRYLKENGANVLGIGDTPYEALQPELKEVLTEYYWTPDMTDYDKVFRATACLIWHHGKIDMVRSNNEFWLTTEARLRTDFNIPGIGWPEILDHKQKSRMKAFFKKAGVACADYCLPKTFEEGKAFTDKHGYPVVVKPDDGVGACDTYTLHNDAEQEHFFATKPPVQYIMETYIEGHVETFDGLTNANGDIVFSASQIYHESLMDTVINDDCITYHSEKETAPDIREAGTAVVKAYGIKNMFFHFEFFRTTDKKTGKSKVMALEVNMRPPGGMITEIYEASHDVNIYKAWADTLMKGAPEGDMSQKRYAAFTSRKWRFDYAHSNDEIFEKYGDHIMQAEAITGITARAMGDFYFLLYADTLDKLNEIISFISEKR